jgi:cyclohexanone monooxygenase
MRKRAMTLIEATGEAQESWAAHVNQQAARTLFPHADSWYMGANVPGKPRVFMPYVGPGYRKKCDAVAASGYEGFILTS